MKDMMSVNISQLEYFVTTVQCGSFTLAAKELFVTPQAVSKSVGDLERELHVQLCEKTGRSVKATPFGHMFSARASEILSCLLDLESLAKTQALSQTQEGAVSLAVTCSPCRGNALHAQDFEAFEKTYPHIKLNTTFTTSGSCLVAMEEGVVDAAVIIGRTTRPNITCTKLYALPLCVAVANNNPLASKGILSASDLQGVPLATPEDLRYCHSIITTHLQAKGVTPRYVALEPFIKCHQEFLDNEQGALFVIADPSLKTLYPSATLLPVAPEDFMSIPLCLAYKSTNDNKSLPHIERYLLGLAARIRRKHP